MDEKLLEHFERQASMEVRICNALEKIEKTISQQDDVNKRLREIELQMAAIDTDRLKQVIQDTTLNSNVRTMVNWVLRAASVGFIVALWEVIKNGNIGN